MEAEITRSDALGSLPRVLWNEQLSDSIVSEDCIYSVRHFITTLVVLQSQRREATGFVSAPPDDAPHSPLRVLSHIG